MLIVGGDPAARQSLLSLLARLDVRAITGATDVNELRSERLAEWADIVVLWDEDSLHPSVMPHFTSGRARAPLVVVNEPGIAAVLVGAMGHLPQGRIG